jgi:acyl phosphate:glycerol-3-phosphate acyltransferase
MKGDPDTTRLLRCARNDHLAACRCEERRDEAISPAMITFAALVVGYLLGAIPFGLVLSRLAGHGDIRNIGSGNIGATNVLRTGNKGLAALTLLLDLCKGWAAVAVACRWGEPAALTAGLGAVVGHMFPVWLGFRGGKGVATALGVLIGLAWPVALIAASIWLAVVFITRYSSLAALVAAAIAGVVAPFLTGDAAAVLIAVIALLVILRHHANIRRLIAGREHRISFRKD